MSATLGGTVHTLSLTVYRDQSRNAYHAVCMCSCGWLRYSEEANDSASTRTIAFERWYQHTRGN